MQVESRGRCAKVIAPHASTPRSHRALYTPRAADEAAAIQALSRAYMESLDKVEVSTLVRAAWPKKADFVGSQAKIQRLLEEKVEEKEDVDKIQDNPRKTTPRNRAGFSAQRKVKGCGKGAPCDYSHERARGGGARDRSQSTLRGRG